VLTSVREVMQEAKALTASAATPLPTDPLRQSALAQAIQLRDQLLALGNTRVGNEFIFGGAETGQPPFLANGTYVGDTVVRAVQLDDGVSLATNHTGDQVLAPALAALDSLIAELGTGTPSSIQVQFAGLAAAHDLALVAQAEVGGRQANVQQVGEDLARRSGQLLTRRDHLREVDPAEAAVNAIAAQTALERAYAVISRILSTNLTDFLR
jgi:flagellar hook-associated protein 3 FlgL